MSIYLKENVDYEWTEVINSYGFSRKCPKTTDGIILKPISEPSRDSIVYVFDKENKLIPALILDGNYLIDGRISNFWYWYEIDENCKVIEERKKGYGCFFASPIDFKVEVKTEYNIIY
jgi:hypothetical protein